MINNKAIFVLYDEVFRGIETSDSDNYLNDNYPINLLVNTGVENIFLPFLHFIGVKNIFFSGIDHMDTGHFWDRDRLYQQLDGTLVKLRQDDDIYKGIKFAKNRANQVGIGIYRLEKNETILQEYEYIEFDKAYKIASNKIVLKEE